MIPTHIEYKRRFWKYVIKYTVETIAAVKKNEISFFLDIPT